MSLKGEAKISLSHLPYCATSVRSLQGASLPHFTKQTQSHSLHTVLDRLSVDDTAGMVRATQDTGEDAV